MWGHLFYLPLVVDVKNFGCGPVAAECQERHHCHMGISSNPSIEPDLFSAQQSPKTPSPSASEPTSSPLRVHEPAAALSPSYVLPSNLETALSNLPDDQLSRLFSALIGALRRRGRKVSVSVGSSRKQRIKEVAPPLAQGKLNAIRAAFKAGVTPFRIAKQFGVSQAAVRKVLANDPSK